MKAKTLAELKASGYQTRTVKEELRANIINRLKDNKALFNGIISYQETVIPQIVNALLSKHNFILLGLRGQAKTRLLRQLVDLLDDEIPVIANTELNDDPFKPISAEGKEILKEKADETPIAWLPKSIRYIEKLATPDVTVADIIGDIDPIKAARLGTNIADERTVHYGLLPRANRGIFAMNEIPDLSAKVQVALFNIMQEGDVQIRGYPIRLPLDVMLVFSANPEDYTARGKIITPLKDRVGSEIRTHYPENIEDAMKITAQEAWLERGNEAIVLDFIAETIEEIAFQARIDRRVDKHSGVSQRLPISLMENALSSAEQRAIVFEEKPIIRVKDIYASLSAITGKLELEYEGELKGAEPIAKDIVKKAVGQVFSKLDIDSSKIVEYFEAENVLKVPNLATAKLTNVYKCVPRLLENAKLLANSKDPNIINTYAEFILEGLYAQKQIARAKEQIYSSAQESEPIRKSWN